LIGGVVDLIVARAVCPGIPPNSPLSGNDSSGGLEIGRLSDEQDHAVDSFAAATVNNEL
jgi:hypothetical protein